MSNKNWYLLQFKQNCHLIAERNLKNQGFETFLPIEKKTQFKYGKKKIINSPLFLNYMFVKIPCEKKWNTVSSTYGVSRIISINGAQKPIPTNLVIELIKRCDKNGILIPPKEFKQGDKIRVINSPFTEFITTIDQIDTQKRIWILMDIMGRRTKIKLSENQAQISY
ncbi:transcriptional activator RfaH [Amylibacter sp.]|nr:transcriptional activator RfaH [Amylibacter sp.]